MRKCTFKFSYDGVKHAGYFHCFGTDHNKETVAIIEHDCPEIKDIHGKISRCEPMFLQFTDAPEISVSDDAPF